MESSSNQKNSTLANETTAAPVYSIRHGFSSPIHKMSFSWSRGNSFRLSFFVSDSDRDDADCGGNVVELRLDSGAGVSDENSQWRRILYGSVSPFALLQSRKNLISSLSTSSSSTSVHYDSNWSECLLEYSRGISSLFFKLRTCYNVASDGLDIVLKKMAAPSIWLAAWELLEIFYVDKQSQTWIPERLVDWLHEYDSVFSDTNCTVHLKLVDLQKELGSLRDIEDSHLYWQGMHAMLAVGWLDIVIKLLHLHGSYKADRLEECETANFLLEAVVFLISTMPRFRSGVEAGRLGHCFESKSDFVKAWEKWRTQLMKLDCSPLWVQCDHSQTRGGLRIMLHIMLGNSNNLQDATYNWIELFISHFIYVRPISMGLESIQFLAQRCIQLKPVATDHKLMSLLTGILEENTEVVLAECSRGFGPWMVAHSVELLTSGGGEGNIFLLEEQHELGGINFEELGRLIYALVLASCPLTWHIAPVYLISCTKQGNGLLEALLLNQPVQHQQTFLKNLEICRLNELGNLSSTIMKMAGICNWKRGRKTCGMFWLQNSQDRTCLESIAHKLTELVGKSICDESFKEQDGMIDLLQLELKSARGLEFIHMYRNFKIFLQEAIDNCSIGAAKKSAEYLILIIENSSTPRHIFPHLLNDSMKLIEWEHPVFDVSQTNLLLKKIEEFSMPGFQPQFSLIPLPIRLALALNLGRVFLD